MPFIYIIYPNTVVKKRPRNLMSLLNRQEGEKLTVEHKVEDIHIYKIKKNKEKLQTN